MTRKKPAMEAMALRMADRITWKDGQPTATGRWLAVVRHRGPECRPYIDQHLPGHYQREQEALEAASAFILFVSAPVLARRAS